MRYKKMLYKIYIKARVLFFSLFFKKDKLSVIYDKNFFEKNIEYSDHSARIFADYVVEKYNPGLLYDFGCGNGIYLKYFQKRGVDIYGLDGSSAAISHSLVNKRDVALCDLRQEVLLERKADLVICFEVAEHLEEKYSDILVSNLTKNTNGFIFFTAAPPGQGGTDHVNEQLRDYWIKKFDINGFSFLGNHTRDVSDYLKKHECVFWLVNNIMIFKKDE